MGLTSELYCVVKSTLGDDVVLHGEPSQWATLSWSDEFGNSIAPFFTTRGFGLSFLKPMKHWQLKCYPVSFVVQVIIADIEQETSFYTIDPVSTETFEALNPVQFLTRLICRKQTASHEPPDGKLEGQEIVPSEALFAESRDRKAEVEYRRLLADADLIFGIDGTARRQSIMFGRSSLEELLRTGQSNLLGVVNVGINRNTMELEKLAALVEDIKGHHDYCAAGTNRQHPGTRSKAKTIHVSCGDVSSSRRATTLRSRHVGAWKRGRCAVQ